MEVEFNQAVSRLRESARGDVSYGTPAAAQILDANATVLRMVGTNGLSLAGRAGYGIGGASAVTSADDRSSFEKTSPASSWRC
ncbi:MAG TPA: hypothetical protein VKE51_15350 [Vicinamibacterales bacterium]|nr:hypothetical protein [Vicinamibacterales bacterium]